MSENIPSICFNFSLISKLFHENVKLEANKKGINSTYRHVFIPLIAHSEGLTQSDICSLSRLKAPSISLLLQQMEKDEFIVREKTKEDNRISVVKLTEKGLIESEKIKNIFMDKEKMIFSCLTSKEIKALSTITDKIIKILKEELNND